MTDTRTATRELQAQFLDTVSKGQDAVVEALRIWADAVASLTPALPVSAVRVSFSSSIRLSSSSLPIRRKRRSSNMVRC